MRGPRNPSPSTSDAAISGSALVVLPRPGTVCNLEQPEEFNAAVRRLLHQADR